ncbi:FG-GAP-like repeat-containing protein [Arthrobacter sp. Soil782]|uniref:FG-GAP-like repeat-containing protein n=1 Tax=Arthrobacter sp. Soil782 TaxID=1736410 RepID=UPI0009E691F6|nr:FG-GAP-like repeat-containing protein [Arthrobacter sp. Soil782]
MFDVYRTSGSNRSLQSVPLHRKLTALAVLLVSSVLMASAIHPAQATESTSMATDPGPAGDFSWKGYNWEKRFWDGAPHYTKDYDAANVSDPDANGHVTLTLSNPTGKAPVAAEFQSTRQGFGYGTYSTTVEKNIGLLQKEVVWGCLFTYDPAAAPGYNEIDLCEASAWGGGAAYGESWPVTQGHGYWFDATKPPGQGNNTITFGATSDAVLTHRMVWEPRKITFETFAGEGYSGKLLKRTVLEGSTVPVPAKEAIHFNLWVTGGGGGKPSVVKPEKVVIRDFSFTPAPPVAPPVAAPVEPVAPAPVEPTPVAPPVAPANSTTGFNGDGTADVVARDSSGALWLYAGDGTGGWLGRTQLGHGWQGFNSILTPGDFDGDENPDVLARDGAGALWLYAGDDSGGVRSGVKIGWGWSEFTSLLAPGDFNGDGNVDVMARDKYGALFLYPGNGTGGWKSPVKIGSGWQGFSTILGPGDFNGDGNVDVMARDKYGALYLYPGNGTGGWQPRAKVGSGWQGFTAILGPGDFNGDGNVDVMARDKYGALHLYPGNGTGGWQPRAKVGSGWNVMTSIS